MKRRRITPILCNYRVSVVGKPESAERSGSRTAQMSKVYRGNSAPGESGKATGEPRTRRAPEWARTGEDTKGSIADGHISSSQLQEVTLLQIVSALFRGEAEGPPYPCPHSGAVHFRCLDSGCSLFRGCPCGNDHRVLSRKENSFEVSRSVLWRLLFTTSEELKE